MAKGKFKISDIINNFKELCILANPRGPLPRQEELTVAFAGGKVAVMQLTSLEKPSAYDHKLKDSKTLFYILLAPGDIVRFSKFERDLTPEGDFVFPVLFMNEKLDRWIGGVNEDIWQGLFSENITFIEPDVKLIHVGAIHFNALDDDENIICNSKNRCSEILSFDNIKVWLREELEEFFPDSIKKRDKDLLRVAIQSTFNLIFVNHEEVKFGGSLWPIHPLPSQYTSRGKGVLYRFLNACGEEADPAHFIPISLSELDAPVGREGVSPRLKWKKLGL